MDGWVTFGHGMYILSVEVFFKVFKGAMKNTFRGKIEPQVAISICKLKKPDQA